MTDDEVVVMMRFVNPDIHYVTSDDPLDPVLTSLVAKGYLHHIDEDEELLRPTDRGAEWVKSQAKEGQ